MEAALGHEGEQAGGFQGDGLAAGVGAGDDQGVEVLSQPQVDGHRRLLVQQGVTGLPEAEGAVVDHPGAHAPEAVGELSPGENHVNLLQKVVVEQDVLTVVGHQGGELRQNALDLLFLPALELPQLVVGLDGGHGLHKEGGAAAADVVDQAGDVALVLALHGDHEAAVADGDDGLLQILSGRGGNQLLQHLPGLAGGGADVPAQVGKQGAGGVGDFLLGEDGAGDAVFQHLVGAQGAEQGVEDGLLLPHSAVSGHLPGGAQHPGHPEQLAVVQAAPQLGTLEQGAYLF